MIYTKRETGVEGTTGLYSINRFDLFPSLHFSQLFVNTFGIGKKSKPPILTSPSL